MKIKKKSAPWLAPFQMSRTQNKLKEIMEIMAGTICAVFVREIIKSIIDTKAKNKQAMASKYEFLDVFIKINIIKTAKPKI
jgi:hypothetical protein